MLKVTGRILRNQYGHAMAEYHVLIPGSMGRLMCFLEAV